MKRLAVPAVALLMSAPLGCAKVKGVDVETTALIPAEANLAIGFQLDPISASPLGPMLSMAMRSEGQMAAAMDAMSACQATSGGLTGVVATDINDQERLFAAIKAPGLGDEDKVRCIEEKVNEATGRVNGLIVFETKGDIRITPKEGGGYLIILNKDTLVDVDKSWEDEVFKAIEDPSARVTDSPLAKAMARVDHNAHAWVSAIIPQAARTELTEVPGADGLDSVSAAVDLGDGLALDLDLGFVEAGKADVFRTAAAAMLEGVKPEAEQLGVPKELLDSVAIAGEGPQVTAKAKVGKDTLPQVIAAAGGLMQ